MNTAELNQRVLIVDDEEVVRDSLRESLCPRKTADPGLESAADALFGGGGAESKAAAPFAFEIAEAVSGRQAIEAVRASLADDKPFAVIFMDMRMPGLDGLETVQEIRRLDGRAEIVFVTAYSDHSIEEVVDRAGPGVAYYCKPFAPDEIRQVAIKAAFDWNRNRDLEKLIGLVSDLRSHESRTRVLLASILDQIGAIVGVKSAVMLQRGDDGVLRAEIATGDFLDEAAAGRAVAALQALLARADVFPAHLPDDGLMVFRLGGDHFVALPEPARPLRADKLYLLALFLEAAASSLKNSRLQEEAQEKERVYALGQALGGIVHDLRNPIGAVLSLAELEALRLEDGDVAGAAEICNYIRAAGSDAMDLLEDLLDFTRNREPLMEDVAVPDLLAQVGQKAPSVLRGFTGSWRIETPAPCAISAQPKKLLRVFLNLLKNAAEALEDAGTPGAEIVLSAEPDGEGIVFRVTDNGPGIPPEVRGNLFRPFFTSGKAQGTGLGLAIVKRLIEAHGSAPEVASEPGRTSFSFRLPLKKA